MSAVSQLLVLCVHYVSSGFIANYDKDYVMPRTRPSGVSSRSFYSNDWLKWPQPDHIPYVIAPGFSAEHEALIHQAFDNFRKETCIRWVPRTSNDQNYVKIVHDRNQIPEDKREGYMTDACLAAAGMMGGEQHVFLVVPGCMANTYIVHELMHALGFLHEQQRADRDCYLKVLDIDGFSAEKYDPADEWFGYDLSWPYDYKSTLHYPYGKEQIISKHAEIDVFGSADRGNYSLSVLDVWQLNHKYCGKHHYCDQYPKVCERLETYRRNTRCV